MFSLPSFKIGRILGFDIEINLTWLVIFAIILYQFTGIYLEETSFGISLALGFITAFIFFFSLILHEVAHSFVARANNLPIKKITLFIFGGVAEMGSEPAAPGVELKMAVAGPLTSLLISALFYLALNAARRFGLAGPFETLLYYIFYLNMALAIFNLLPGFPLDGGRIVRAVLWHFLDDIKQATKAAAILCQVLAYFLIFLGVASIFAGIIAGIWPIMIGWFLSQAAQGSYQNVVLQKALSGVKVSELMTPNVVTASAEVNLAELVEEYFMRYRFGRFPVVDDGRLLGVVTLHDVKEVPKESWPSVRAGDIAHMAGATTISMESDAVHALMQMASGELGHLLVVDADGRLVGLVTRTDIIRLIKIKSELGS
ncbi:MAG: site-2 protease family protein [Actinomycetota bacterium]|nr:site-2 protease family protein [Actinomycetota bacterium]